MTALAYDRNTQSRNAEIFEFPINAGTTIYRGAIVAINAAGAALRPQDVGATMVVGVAQTGSADFLPGAQTPQANFPTGGVVIDQPTPFVRTLRKKQFAFANSSGADLILQSNWGAVAYAVDDQTVALTNGGSGRLAVGVIRGVDALGVWVEIS